MQQTGYKTERPTQTKHVPQKPADVYSSIGKMIPSQRPSAPEYSMGKAKKQTQKKLFISEDFSKTDMRGTSYTAAPNSYFQSTLIKQKNGKDIMNTLIGKDLDMKYEQPKRTIIGNQAKGWKNNYYSHYSNPDQLQLNEADRNRKIKSVCAVMGTESRFMSEYPGNKPTPSPFVYEPGIGTNFDNPPKYSFARKAQSEKKLRDGREIQTPNKRKLTLKLNGPSPATYFKEQSNLNKTRSQSVNFLRVPQNSHMKSTSAHKFPLSHRSSLAQNRAGYMQQTYDIKTKTLMKDYDFENDGGKGQHSGLGWLKGTIDYHSRIPQNKTRMKSSSIGKSQRGEPSRGTFKVHMEFKPTPIRIQHPKF